MNPRCPPCWVFGDHAEDQLSELLREYFSTSGLSYFRDQFPVKTEASPVPPHNSLRRHDNHRVLPLGPNPPGRYPKQLVEGIQSWSPMAAFEHRELLSQREIFQQETTTGTKQTCNRPNAKPNRREHRSDITQFEKMRLGFKLLILKPSSILATHSLLKPDVGWFQGAGNRRRLKEDDILIVAPYNAQVADLKLRLPKMRIGTVDKFQGQEAPVVIYSLTTSSLADAPRGMEFLYSLNRLNVATSRAMSAVVLVGSQFLFEPECQTPRQMQLANALCRYRELATLIELPKA